MQVYIYSISVTKHPTCISETTESAQVGIHVEVDVPELYKCAVGLPANYYKY